MALCENCNDIAVGNDFVICDFLFKFYWLWISFQSGDAKIEFQCGTWCRQCNLVIEWCSLAVNENWWTAIAYSHLRWKVCCSSFFFFVVRVH